MDRHFLLDDNQSVTSPPPSSASNDNFDKVLFRNLVEMVPLVQSLMDRRSKTSFSRRASLIYTKTPAKDLNSRKASDAKGRKSVQVLSTRKQRVTGSGHTTSDTYSSRTTQDVSGDECSILTSKSLTSEKEREEFLMLRQQVEELQKKLVEKDQELKSVEESINNISLVQMEVANLQRQMEEKDSLIRSAHLQLSDAKIKLADKQAALEKLEWEAKKSSDRENEVKNELDILHKEISMFMRIFETSKKTISHLNSEEHPTFDKQNACCRYPSQAVDTSENHKHEKIEITRNEYLEAIAVAKENLDEDSLLIASQARLNLLSSVSGMPGMEVSHNNGDILNVFSRSFTCRDPCKLTSLLSVTEG